MPYALPLVFDRRLVLFPQGQPQSTRHRDRCLERVLWCGGDIDRIIDAPIATLDMFIGFASRIRGLRDGNEQALVVLTKTNPLALAVVSLRRQLESRLPPLRSARWMIYLDTDADPFFGATAVRLGHLTAELSQAPIWMGPEGSPYLVMVATLEDREVVCWSLRELDDAIHAMSGERRVKA